MKITLFALLGLVSLAATCAVYGWLESSVNMIEGLSQLFAPGATTIIFSPFLLLMILLTLAVFVGVPLLAVAATAVGCGIGLRSTNQPVLRSFTRPFVFAAAACQFVVILVSAEQNAWFLFARPAMHPKSPDYVLAFLAAANACLQFLTASAIIRKLTVGPRQAPPPLASSA